MTSSAAANALTCSGCEKNSKKRIEIKRGILGTRGGEKRECEFLGRTIRVTPNGFQYEGNQKHVKILLEEWGMQNAKPLSSPGSALEKPNARDKQREEEKLSPKESKDYRRAAARINYMALDRADLSYASKEASRGMANPTVGDCVRLKRILRYLQGHPRAINEFAWQELPNVIRGMCDSDWAGCVKTRKSTSGGFLMHGAHVLAHWSSTQTVIALSSAEAELNATVKMISEALGVKNFMKGIYKTKKVLFETDSTACKGIVQREGCGKIKHLETRQLWVQQYVNSKDVTVRTIPRAINCSDCLTHHWERADGLRHLNTVGISFVS